MGRKCVAQTYTLKVIPIDTGKDEQYTFRQLSQVWHFLNEKQNKLREKGFLSAAYDSTSIKDSVVSVWLYQGQEYHWAKVDFSTIDPLFWNRLNITVTNWQNQSVSPKELASLYEKVLTYCENNGYPFATCYLDSLVNKPDGLHARFRLKTGALQKIDTIILEGDADIALSFLENYLDIYQGMPYDEHRLNKISKRIRELPFLRESNPWRMEFAIDRNRLYLYLSPESANQINGLLGLQPNTQETGKFLLTADFLLGLHNSLGYGETIEATYKNLEYKSPQFHAHVVAPYVLGSPLGLEGSFDLYKKDTTYRKTVFETGVRYAFHAEDYLRVFYQNSSNRLITADTHFVHTNKKLPDNIDFKSQGFGMALSWNRTDYKMNPRKGWTATFSVLGNIRTVIPNDAILSIEDTTGFDYKQLFSEANKKKQQLRLNAIVTGYLPIYKTIVGMLGYQGGWIYGNNLFQNELFRLGGFHSLRGFDENGFFANQYHIASIEIHFNFGPNSYFYLFNDDAFVETSFQGYKRKDYPVSFGAGISLENKTGIFNIAIGLGKHSGDIFEFRKARVHFGYAAYF